MGAGGKRNLWFYSPSNWLAEVLPITACSYGCCPMRITRNGKVSSLAALACLSIQETVFTSEWQTDKEIIDFFVPKYSNKNTMKEEIKSLQRCAIDVIRKNRLTNLQLPPLLLSTIRSIKRQTCLDLFVKKQLITNYERLKWTLAKFGMDGNILIDIKMLVEAWEKTVGQPYFIEYIGETDYFCDC